MESYIEFLKTKMVIEEVDQDVNYAQVSGHLNRPLETTINEIESYFKDTGYTTIFGRNKGRETIKIGIVHAAKERPRIWINILLFIATLFTTLWAGSTFQGGNPMANLKDLLLGIPFSFSLMAILTGHELGHYFVSRRFGMATSLPYFIPMPNFIGTFGAMIRMKSIVPDRRSLMKVGMAGPIVGFLIALPITVIGIALSRSIAAPSGEAYMRLGDSLLFSLIVKLIHPVMPKGTDLFLHPMAFAGWIGFLVTGMNLIPIGQLDGGHVAYGLLFEHRKKIYIPLGLLLIGFGLLWPGWLVWGFLAFIMARRDPLVKNGLTPLTKREIAWGLVAFLLLLLTFIPQPIVITR